MLCWCFCARCRWGWWWRWSGLCSSSSSWCGSGQPITPSTKASVSPLGMLASRCPVCLLVNLPPSALGDLLAFTVSHPLGFSSLASVLIYWSVVLQAAAVESGWMQGFTTQDNTGYTCTLTFYTIRNNLGLLVLPKFGRLEINKETE